MRVIMFQDRFASLVEEGTKRQTIRKAARLPRPIERLVSIVPVNWNRYPKAWKRVSRLIRFRRARGFCEWCGAENGKPHPITGSKVVLTVAHLGEPFAANADKHDKHDIRAENLAALCQRCHLRHDIREHMDNARKTRETKRRQREPMLFEC